jgi:hypothetical protein
VLTKSNIAKPLIIPAVYQSIIDSLRQRLLTTNSSQNVSARAAETDAAIYRHLLTDLETLDPRTWNVNATIADEDLVILHYAENLNLMEDRPSMA